MGVYNLVADMRWRLYKYVQKSTSMNNMCKYLCTKSVDIVRKHVVLDMGFYNLVADMRWRLYDGVEVMVSTSLLPYSSSSRDRLHHHQLKIFWL